MSVYRFGSAREAHEKLRIRLRYPSGDMYKGRRDLPVPLPVAASEIKLDADNCAGGDCWRWLLNVRYGQYVVNVYNDNIGHDDGDPERTSRAEFDRLARAVLSQIAH